MERFFICGKQRKETIENIQHILIAEKEIEI